MPLSGLFETVLFLRDIISKTMIKNRIRTYRLKRGLTQKDVSILLGYKNQSLLSHWENDKKTPTLKNFFKLASILKIFPAEMLFNELFDEIKHEIHQRKHKLGIWEKYE